MIVEPCCIQNQLPQLMQAKKCGCFYSNGDWGAEKLMWATAWLVDGPAMTVLLMRSVDVYFLRYLRQCLQREWTAAIALATKENCEELVNGELKGYADKVIYTCRPNLQAQGYYRYSSDGCMAVCGPLDNQKQYCQYWFVNGHQGRFTEAMEGVVPMFIVAVKGKPLGTWCEEIQGFLVRRFYGKD